MNDFVDLLLIFTWLVDTTCWSVQSIGIQIRVQIFRSYVLSFWIQALVTRTSTKLVWPRFSSVLVRYVNDSLDIHHEILTCCYSWHIWKRNALIVGMNVSSFCKRICVASSLVSIICVPRIWHNVFSKLHDKKWARESWNCCDRNVLLLLSKSIAVAFWQESSCKRNEILFYICKQVCCIRGWSNIGANTDPKACRGMLARKSFGSFRENNAATQIQRLFRGW